MKGCIVPIVVIGALAILGKCVASEGTRKKNELYTKACIEQKSQMNAIIAYWTASGVIKEFVHSNVEVNEFLWGNLERKQRLSILIASYCRSADEHGGGLTKAISSRTGEPVRGYVIDGNYFD
jgi:hypothetical protein